MKRLLRFVPFLLTGSLGGDAAYGGFRYIVFFSGGSGFVMPVPLVWEILFFVGLVLLVAALLALWTPRFSAAASILGLGVYAATIIQQTATHPDPSSVVVPRGSVALLCLATSAVLYVVHLRRPATAA